MGAFVLGLILGCVVVAIVRSGQLTGLKKQLADALGRAAYFERTSADLGARLQAADREIAFLSRYRNIPNAEAHAQQIVSSAQQHANALVERGQQQAVTAKNVATAGREWRMGGEHCARREECALEADLAAPRRVDHLETLLARNAPGSKRSWLETLLAHRRQRRGSSSNGCGAPSFNLAKS